MSWLLQHLSLPLQVTLETVDEAILGMTERKLKLDAAVMDGLTASSSAGTKGKGAAETAAMGQLLQAMLTGDGTGADELHEAPSKGAQQEAVHTDGPSKCSAKEAPAGDKEAPQQDSEDVV